MNQAWGSNPNQMDTMTTRVETANRWKRRVITICALLMMGMASVSMAWEPATGDTFLDGWFGDQNVPAGAAKPHLLPQIGTYASEWKAGPGATVRAITSNSVSLVAVGGVSSTSLADAKQAGDYVYVSLEAKSLSELYRLTRVQINAWQSFTENTTNAGRYTAVQGSGATIGMVLVNPQGAETDLGTLNAYGTLANGGVNAVSRSFTTPPNIGNLASPLPQTYQLRFYLYCSTTSCGYMRDAPIGSPTVSNMVFFDNPQVFVQWRQLVALRKTWVNAATGSIATITPVGTALVTPFISTADTSDETDVSSYYDVNTGATFNVSETVTGGTYVQSRTCTVIRADGSAPTVTPPYVIQATDRSISCTYKNSRMSLTVVKKVLNDNGGSANVSAFGIATNMGSLTFGSGTSSGNTTTYTSNPVYGTAAGTYTLTESDVANYSEGTWSCSGTGVTMGGTAFNAGSVTLTDSATATCTITNNDSNVADLAIVKTRTPSGTLTVGQTVNYSVVVTNNGPATATGAVITDTPQSGLSCPAGNTVNCAGPGCPAATTTVGTLTAGWTLGTLTSSQSVTLTFSCTAQ